MEYQFDDPVVLKILIPPPPFPEVETTMLTMYGFSPTIYADLLLDFISVGYSETMYTVISSECDYIHLTESHTASIIAHLETIARILLNHILTRQHLHFLLVSDFNDVSVDDQGNWLIDCSINESKYEMAKNGSQYALNLPNLAGQAITPHCTYP